MKVFRYFINTCWMVYETLV